MTIGTYLFKFPFPCLRLIIVLKHAFAYPAIRNQNDGVEILNKEPQSIYFKSKELLNPHNSRVTSPHTSVTDSVSTETSQLERISRHLAPHASMVFTPMNTRPPATGKHDLYFQPNKYQREHRSPIPRTMSSFELVIPASSPTNEIFQIDSRLNRREDRMPNENDSQKSGHEIVEIAQLHERYGRQERQSSEEDMIAMETFIGK